MADTIGDLIDKLTISNIRLWHLEDSRRDYCNDTVKLSEEELRNLLKKINQTNRERNSLIDQINASFRILIDKAVSKDSKFTIAAEELLGTGKNKFYNGEDKK
jgi:hypothetical protein